MANEIKYTVTKVDGTNLSVTYTMDTATVEMIMLWDGSGDVDEFLKIAAPRHLLAAQLAPPHDASLVGKTGTADLSLAPPASLPATDPPASPNTNPAAPPTA